MKKDPFAHLAGLDQQLFQDEAPAADSGGTQTKNPTGERASERVNEGASERAHKPSSDPFNEASSEPSLEGARQRTGEATRTRASALRGGFVVERRKQRLSHDVFRDQTLWMNRLKLELEEKYGKRVTGNEIVQTAIDLLRADYVAKKGGSTLIRVLVRGEGPGRDGEAA